MDLGPDPLKTLAPLTYVAGGAGLWGLIHWFFKFPEEHLAPGVKEAIARWLLEVDPAARVKNWPETFGDVFDALFTKKHLSWKCFWRSCAASYVSIALMTLAYWLLSPEGFAANWEKRGWNFILLISALAPLLNLIPDYLSLLETRYVIRWMAKANRTRQILLLAMDGVFTVCIFLLALFFLGIPVLLWIGVLHPSGDTMWEVLWREWLEFVQVLPALFRLEDFSGIYLWSTFLTSIWSWVYVLSGIALRPAAALAKGIGLIRDVFDVRNKPLSSMGLVGGGLCACTWWGACLVSWLV